MTTRTTRRLEHFAQGYAMAMLNFNTHVISIDDESNSEPVEAAWWQRPDDTLWAVHAFEQDSQGALLEDVVDFFQSNLRELMAYAAIIRSRLPELVTEDESDQRAYSAAGQDFALTRNGHGTGFWDRGMPDVLAATLSGHSKVYGGSQAWLNADENEVQLQNG